MYSNWEKESRDARISLLQKLGQGVTLWFSRSLETGPRGRSQAKLDGHAAVEITGVVVARVQPESSERFAEQGQGMPIGFR